MLFRSTNVELNQGIEYDVSIHKIDTLKIENIGLIKIDVEGSDLDVLAGAKKIIQQYKINYSTHRSRRT